MKTLLRLVAILLLVGGGVYAQTEIDPPCYNNTPPPAHYRTETAADGSTLRVVGVWVDPVIDGGNFTQGVNLAIENWNNQKDASGRDLPYRFERVSDPAQAGIKIAGGGETCAYGCACYSFNTGTIRTSEILRDNSAESIAGMIGHEIGHPMGLANSRERFFNTSIMQAGLEDCEVITRTPQPNDVAQVNRHATNRGTCTVTANMEADTEFDCPDDDADGVTACGGDCDDYDPSLTYDCSYYDPEPDPPSGGGGAETCYREYECTEFYTCGEDAYGYGCEYQGIECGQTGYCQCGGYYTYCPY